MRFNTLNMAYADATAVQCLKGLSSTALPQSVTMLRYSGYRAQCALRSSSLENNNHVKKHVSTYIIDCFQLS